MFSFIKRGSQNVITKDVLMYEDGAILPRQNGKTTRKMKYLDSTLSHIAGIDDYYNNGNLRILLVCDTKSQAKEFLKKYQKSGYGWSKDFINNKVIISTPKTLSKDIEGFQIFDIIDDSSQLDRGGKLELDFRHEV